MKWLESNLVKILQENGVVVMPTDTIYGIVGKALNPSVVSRIYDIRKRAEEKPCIILIGDIDDISKFSVNLSKEQKVATKEYWPGPVSVVLDCTDDKLEYLHRGTKTLAFRLPIPEGLRELLKKVGPLIAPSANPEGLPTALNIVEAKEYFGNSVDLYMDGGIVAGKPSKVIKLHKDGSVSILRE